MDKQDTLSALNALALPGGKSGEAPQWLRLFPKDEATLGDGRGRLYYTSASEVIAASYAAKGRIHIDLEHSSLPGRKGGDTRAYGYVTAMEEREDGIWGQVDWTAAGAELMKDRAYWGVSPVLTHDKTGRIKSVVSVALTNGPALRELTALTFTEMENRMDFRKLVVEMLGLPDDVSDEDAAEALRKKFGGGDVVEGQVAMTALTSAHTALGLSGEVKPAAILSAINDLLDDAAQRTALTEQVAALTEKDKRRDAEAFVDQAIRDKRVGVVPERDTYIALHMEDPARATRLINALPQLGDAGLEDLPPDAGDEISALTAEEIAGKARAYQALRKTEGVDVDIATAVNAVMEGKA